MKYRKGTHVVKFLLFAAVAVLLLGGALMLLWNGLVPPIFGWHTITYGQAVGLFVLSRILFGRPRLGGGRWRGMQWRRRMSERWEQMTPEERERFRGAMREHCGPFGESKPSGPAAQSIS